MGTALKKGELIRSLPLENQAPQAGRHLTDEFQPTLDLTAPIRVLPGPQFDYFTREGQETFTGSIYTISPISDRQGCRTEGPSIERARGPDIITDPIPLGSIQVPGNGLPIILLKDAQVTGGYAKIGLAARVDLDRVGQLSPGDKIRFKWIRREEALELLKNQVQLLDEAREILGDGSRSQKR
jgi:allophanate hydrolase subunit 2